MAQRDPAGLRIHSRLFLPWRELTLEAARSGGPGGQNVNKTASKVVLRFDLRASPSLSEGQRERLSERLASRLTTRGEIVIHASRFRDRAQNERDACERLAALLAEGLRREKPRRATRPTRGSIERRLAAKKRRSETKRGRGAGGEA